MTDFSEKSKRDTESKIAVALATLAIFRGASPGTRVIESYSGRLANENLADVITAIEQFQEMPREKGDPAFPEIGLLIEMAKVAGLARDNYRKYGATTPDGKARSVLARWECPDCRVTTSGYITADDFLPRRCQGIPGSGSTQSNAQGHPICGAVLVQTHRVAA